MGRGNQAPRLISIHRPDPQAEVAAGRLWRSVLPAGRGHDHRAAICARLDDDISAAGASPAGAGGDAGLPAAAVGRCDRPIARPSLPGNVRELENMMRRLALIAAGPIFRGQARPLRRSRLGRPAPRAPPMSPATGMLAPAALARPAFAGWAEPRICGFRPSVEMHLQRYFDLHGDQLPPPGLYDRILREIEKPLLEIALDATGGNQLRCADLLGINRNTLRKKTDRPEYRSDKAPQTDVNGHMVDAKSRAATETPRNSGKS